MCSLLLLSIDEAVIGLLASRSFVSKVDLSFYIAGSGLVFSWRVHRLAKRSAYVFSSMDSPSSFLLSLTSVSLVEIPV